MRFTGRRLEVCSNIASPGASPSSARTVSRVRVGDWGAKKLGITTKARMSYYDLIIVGGGPAGLTAAIYAAREGMDVLVIDAGGLGGQAGMTEKLENFPGFPDGINGAEFADRLVRQARKFDVEILQATKIETTYQYCVTC